MKFLDNYPELELLSKALSFSSPSLKVTTRIEALSCKPLSRERKLFKVIEQDIASDIELTTSISPPDAAGSQLDSAFGPLDKRASRKTLWMLISTLNASYPDFDFSTVHAEEFTRETSATSVLSSLSNALNHLRASATSGSASVYRSFSSYTPVGPTDIKADEEEHGGSPTPLPPNTNNTPTHPFLRQVLDPIISLNECEVYSYSPDIEADPHALESETGSVAATEERHFTEDLPFPMDGFGMPPSAPSTPGSGLRRLRSGKTYFASRSGARGLSGTASNAGQRSRSQTPSRYGDEDSTGGLLWSRLFFFYNKSKKRILFISHHAKRTAPMGGSESTLNTPLATPDPHRSHSIAHWAEESTSKRRGSSLSLAGFMEDQANLKRVRVL